MHSPINIPISTSTPITPLSPVAPYLDFITDTANMLKAFIGLNFMYVAYAFSKAGLSRAIPALLFITLLTEHCCVLLVRVKNAMTDEHTASSRSPVSSYTPVQTNVRQPQQSTTPPTYGDIARFVGGLHMEMAVNAALVLTQFGYCVGYLIFLSSTVHHMLPPNLQSTLPVSLFVLIPIPILSSLAMLSSIRSLGPFSMTANFALLTGFISVVVFLTQHYRWQPVEPPLSSFPLFFGQITAALEGIGLVVPVENSMKQRSRFKLVLRVALATLTTVLMVVGIMGFATFGADTSSILLTNFGRTPIVAVVKAVLVVGILFTYPLQIIPVFQFVEGLIIRDGTTGDDAEEGEEVCLDESDADSDCAGEDVGVLGITAEQSIGVFVTDKRRVALRLVVVALTAVTAIMAGKNFGLVQSLVGSLGASCLAYTAPAWFHYRIYGQGSGWGMKMKDLGIVVFGIVGAVAGTTAVVLAFVRGEGEGV